ncbi:MAG: HD domain-containing protein [Ardenticatenia bacterium]|nr:HD domain-containing protein [Ardenticatenia bacterium]
MTTLSTRFQEAMVYAAQLHAGQVRKGSGTPYIAHLLAVTSLVLEHDGDEDEATAALLHDAAEDQGGEATLAEIRRRFGPAVAEIVEGCSDTMATPKPSWRARKEAFLARLPHASPSVRLVSTADKLHNARTILADLRMMGDAVWDRFQGGREGTLWYHRSLVEILRVDGSNPLAEELDRVVSEIERLAPGEGAR